MVGFKEGLFLAKAPKTTLARYLPGRCRTLPPEKASLFASPQLSPNHVDNFVDEALQKSAKRDRTPLAARCLHFGQLPQSAASACYRRVQPNCFKVSASINKPSRATAKHQHDQLNKHDEGAWPVTRAAVGSP